MKHLPYALLLALGSVSASAASGPSSLFANNVELSYAQLSTDGTAGHVSGWGLSATAYLGSSDVFINGITTVGGDLGNGADVASLGYRFKNVAASVDVAVTVGSDESYGLALHRALGNGFGAWASYGRRADGHDMVVALSKSLTRDISLDLSYAWRNNDAAADQNVWALGIRQKF